MVEIWEDTFRKNGEIWGMEPAKSAILAKDFFLENKVKNVLVPGIGYGRNAKIFKDNGIKVTGIEISQTAINLTHKHFGNCFTIHHGSVTEMPFDEKKYDGIFCYALIHLLSGDERRKFIADCYHQLAENGVIVFTSITKESPTYGRGKQIERDRFEMFGGVKMFFYDEKTIQDEFGLYGLSEVTEVKEDFPFYLIKCRKQKQ